MTIQVVILAAGQGKRMHSSLPKVMHALAGKPLLKHVIDTALAVAPGKKPVIVYGHQGQILRDQLGEQDASWVEQKEQLGTGHALLQAMPAVKDQDRVLVLYGDVPLISVNTLNKLIAATPAQGLGMITARLPDPAGYGRILRDAHNQIVGIVEEKDATETERAITEINPGIYLLQGSHLKKWLPRLGNTNAQGEYYLTDVITLAVNESIPVQAVQPAKTEEILGVNDRIQLARLERFYQREAAENLMRQGVTLLDPERVDIRGEVRIGRDVVIDVNVILEGRVVIGDRCLIGAHTILRDTTLGENVEIRPHSLIDGAQIADECVIGPFARVRPGTQLGGKVHIGNFVEVKKSRIAEGTKINHLSYIGDSKIGRQVNIGAGTITCNYDGVNKHRTIIGDNAFIGSCTQLVAPVTVGARATIGAGSTIIHDAPPDKLTLSRAPQQTIDHWQRPLPESQK
ncbi:Bifunctional protein GlmU [Aquicella siphonis]|uniref:Bifunctional protein GlmU n=1 Tax=Aquicella siphonis TaxID=254247 RepID=A0A5E4PEK7_9COXI|nr:bifunctional UDP-N-acetylglucosamine diphosphorylase/glucosamine-1-phosphate N-acetyltransferase GlmU [Aquicella siphonis]VVC74791.1 Bifunctional protein GlmU [Aquicella siphonis]